MLDELAAKWDSTAIGVEISDLDHMTVIAHSQSKSSFRFQVDVASRFPALQSATGRQAATYSELPWREIEMRFREVRWGKAPNVATWRKELEQVRQRGFSIDRGNYIPGVTIIRAPVFDRQGRLTHTLVAIGIAHLVEGARAASITKELVGYAKELSASALGG